MEIRIGENVDRYLPLRPGGFFANENPVSISVARLKDAPDEETKNTARAVLGVAEIFGRYLVISVTPLGFIVGRERS